MIRKRHKFNATKVEVDGRRFDSKREAKRAEKLMERVAAGEVRNLRFQVKFDLVTRGPGGTVTPIRYRTKRGLGRIASHTVDFSYQELVDGKWMQRLEDSKGMDPQASRLRRAVVETMLGIEIQLV